MFAEDFAAELSALQAAPFSKASEKAAEEGDVELGSGRTPSQLVDLAQDLAAISRERWEHDSYDAVPAPTRENIIASLGRLRMKLEQYVNGQVTAQDLEKDVNQLHVLLWQNNVFAGGESERLFAAKNKQLERLKDKGRRINRELREGLTHRDALKTGAEAIDKTREELNEVMTTSKTALANIKSASADAQAEISQVKKVSGEIDRIENAATQTLERIRAADNEVGALKKKVELFYQTIDERTKGLEDLESESSDRVSDLEKRSDEILKRHEALQEQVDEQLQKAAGASLFHAFQARRGQLTMAKWIWTGISIAVLVGTVFWTVYLAQAAASLDTAFFVKLGGTLPVLAVVVFCLSQYGRERRAEEEYAFKSALSLSLVPYKDLVESLETGQGDAEYAKFLTGTINQIYSPPRLAKETSSKRDPSTLKVMELVNDLVERIVNR